MSTIWPVTNSHSTRATKSRILTLCMALVAAGGSGFAQIVNVLLPEPPTASIEGIITAGVGQGQADAVPGVLVKLTGASSAPDPLSATTDADGHYRFTKLFPGAYTIDGARENLDSILRFQFPFGECPRL